MFTPSFSAKFSSKESKFHQDARYIANSRYDEAQRILMRTDGIIAESQDIWKQASTIYKKAIEKDCFKKLSIIRDYKTGRKIEFTRNPFTGSQIAKLYQDDKNIKSIIWSKENIVIQDVLEDDRTNSWIFDYQGNLSGYMVGAKRAYKGTMYEQMYSFCNKKLTSYFVKNNDAQITDEEYEFKNDKLKVYRNDLVELANGSLSFAVEIVFFEDNKNYDFVSKLTTERLLKVRDGSVFYDGEI